MAKDSKLASDAKNTFICKATQKLLCRVCVRTKCGNECKLRHIRCNIALQVNDLACGYGCPKGGKDFTKKHILCPERRKKIKIDPMIFETSGFIGELSKGSIKTLKTHLSIGVVVELTITTLFYVKRYYTLLVPGLCGMRHRIFPEFRLDEGDSVQKMFAKTVKREEVMKDGFLETFVPKKDFLGLSVATWKKVCPGTCAYKRFFGCFVSDEPPGETVQPHNVAKFVPQQPPMFRIGDYDEIVCFYCKKIYNSKEEYVSSCVPDSL